MNLIISFSGRKGGNSDVISEFISKKEDEIVYFRDLNVHECSHCNYECFIDNCKYHEDDIYNLYESMLNYSKVFLIVPMYCGNPSSLYFKFNERCQEYFMRNEDAYEAIISKLYIIGIYGDKDKTPDFIPTLAKWFECAPYQNRIIGIERHKYNQKINDCILDIDEVKELIEDFVGK